MSTGTAGATNFAAPIAKTAGVRVSVVALVGWAVGAWAAAGAALAGLVAVVAIGGGWQALLGAGAIGAAVAVVGLGPVVLAARTGQAQTIAFGFLAGSVLRMGAAFLALLLLTRRFDMPGTPLAIMTMVYYFAGLIAEVVVLKRQLRKSGPHVQGPG